MSEEQLENEKQAKGWLERVAEQSWEPELLISGLAIFATSQLPEYIMKGWYYYDFNLKVSDSFIDEMIPILITSAVISAIEILYFAFIIHFVIRAFWVGMIGLNSVFPKGIQYQKLQVSEYYKVEMEKRLGNTKEFLLATDKAASIIFSVAFSIVMLLTSIVLLYLVFFLLMNITKLLMSESVFEIYTMVMLAILIIFFLIMGVAGIVLNMQKYRENPKTAEIHFKFTWFGSHIIYPLFVRPINHLILIFISNIPLKKYHTVNAILMAIFFVMLIFRMLSVMDVHLFNSRDFYIEFSEVSVMNTDRYLESFKGEYVRDPMLDKKVIESGSLLGVYIPYSKMLDTKLSAICDFEEPADSLYRFERRALLNQSRIDCANQFYSFSIDDSLRLTSDLMFSKHTTTGQPGYYSKFNVPDTLVSGMYMFNVRQAIADDVDAHRDSIGRLKEYDFDIPFWIE